jgi:hypothetical protein
MILGCAAAAAFGQAPSSFPRGSSLQSWQDPGLKGVTLFGIVFYWAWGTASARNRVIAIPTIAQGYTGRAK